MSQLFSRPGASSARQGGFSLMELMIAMVIGLVVVLAMVTLFASVSRGQTEMKNDRDQVENGRFAMFLLQDELTHAGYWGSFAPEFEDMTISVAPPDAPTAIPDPCLAVGTWNAAHITNLIGIPVAPSATVPGTCAATATVLDKVANTDVLTVRHLATCAVGETGCADQAVSVANVYMLPSRCSSQLTTTPYVMGVGVPTSPYGSFSSMTQIDCATPITNLPVAQWRMGRYVSNIFYVRSWSQVATDGIPTLVRSQFDATRGAATPVALLDGIQGFAVELGIDSVSKTGAAVDYTAAVNWTDITNKNSPTNRGDGVPDGAFKHCSAASPCTTAELTNAVAAKIYVLARNINPTPGYVDTKTYTLGSQTMGPFNDGFKRHVFSTTVRLNNVSARRETP